MKKKIIATSILTAILIVVVYFANATTNYPAPAGSTYSRNGVPVTSSYTRPGTFHHKENLTNGYRVYCWETPFDCYTVTSTLLTIYDLSGKSQTPSQDTPVSYDDIQYYYP